ncbi:neutral amino acid transporter 9-like [Pleurodeles waltl]|uniref:neutral amino acid transporter 9-like n=1 Tax=Pleurodeles waltl TaxID=8319 RepID=UPI00370975D0
MLCLTFSFAQWCAASIDDQNKGCNHTSSQCSPSTPCNNSTATTPWTHWWHLRDSVPFYLTILVLPLLNFRSATFFSKFNNLGIVSVAYLILLVTVKASQWGVQMKFLWIKGDDFFIAEFNPSFPIMSGTLMLAYFMHNCIITLMRNNDETKNNVRDLCIGYLLVCLTYLYIGIIFFISFPSPPIPKTCIAQNFLDNLPISDMWGMIGRLLLLFQLITVYPLLAFIIRVQLFQELFKNVYPSFCHVLALNIFLVVLSSLMAKFYPNIGSIIRYSGAISGLVFIFIFPFLIHLIDLQGKGKRTVLTTIFHVFLMLLGLANLIGQFLV